MAKKKHRRKLKVKNIAICSSIVIGLVVGTILFFNSGTKSKTTDNINKTINNTSNSSSNEKNSIVKKEFISIKIGDSEPSILDYIVLVII